MCTFELYYFVLYLMLINTRPSYPSSNSLHKQQLISGSSGNLQKTTLGPTSSFTVIIGLRMYGFFDTGNTIKPWRFPPFLYAWFLIDSGADFKAGTPRNGNEMCFIFSKYPICDHKIRDPLILGI